jgi:tetratricopeptide (TPR) repeat protein
MKYLIPLLLITACASTPDKAQQKDPEKVTSQSFKKERPLTNSQVSDFYEGNVQAISPALQDETIDKYNNAELKSIKTAGDPLLEIAVKCHQREFKEAFLIASQNFSRYQKVAAYWNQVANCHLNSGSYRKALLFYNKALEVSRDYVPALNNIGVMYSRQGQDQKALIAFEKANRNSKFSKTPRYNLARIYLTYGLAEQALPLFQSLLEESPTDIDLLNAVASSHFILSDYQKALNTYQLIPKNHWKSAEIGLNISLTLKKVGRTEDAKKVFDMVAKPEKTHLKSYYSTVASQLGDAE